MNFGLKLYTVKDNNALSNNTQSKCLAFAVYLLSQAVIFINKILQTLGILNLQFFQRKSTRLSP